MKKILLILIPLFIFISAANSKSITHSNGLIQTFVGDYEIRHMPNKKTIYVSMEYKDYKTLLAETKESLNNRMVSSSELQTELKKVPKGGIAIIKINRTTITAANTEHFEYIVKQNGREVMRRKGRYRLANVPVVSHGTWWNIDIVKIPNPIHKNIELYVIDNLQGGRDSFQISKIK